MSVVTAALGARSASAESIADAVRKHVATGLDDQAQKEPPRPPPPKRNPPSKPSRPPPPRPPPRTAAPAAPEPSAPPEPPDTRPPVPQRIIGKDLRIDPTLGGGLRGWIPAQYPTVHTSAGTYFTWSVDLAANLFGLGNLHRGYYESNGISGPRHEGASVVAERTDTVKRAAYLLGMIGIPITRAWEPIIMYETRAFRTSAQPTKPVRIVPYDTPPNTDLSTIPATMSPLSMVSGFETLVIGIRYDQGEDHSATIDPKAGPFPPFYLGVGFTQYSKPYQVTVGDSTLDSVLFDARFRGAGLALGAELPTIPDHVIFEGEAQVGLGEVRLLDNLTLNELLPNTPGRSSLQPPEWLIGYLEGNINVGYLYPLLRTAPSVLVSLVGTGGGATFFYFKTQTEKGQTVGTPPLNWDFLWSVRANVTVPL